MRTLFASVSVLSLCASSLLFGGCETSDCKTEEGQDAVCAESLDEFLGDEQMLSEAYTAGQNVTIAGIYGDIAVIAGDEGVVSVTFMPFNRRGHGQEDDARRELEENLDLAVTAEGEDITVSSGRHDATNGLGSHITVSLPPEFDGVLIVQNEGDGVINQGNISVGYVGQAQVLNVVNHGLQNCNILRPKGMDKEPVPASTLIETDVRCGADIYVRAVNDNVYVDSREPSFHSDVYVEIASISASAAGGEIKGADTDIRVLFPEAGDYSISASTAGSGGHINDVVPGGCETTSSDDTSLELQCGAGGPIYTLHAVDGDPDDDENSFVDVRVTL